MNAGTSLTPPLGTPLVRVLLVAFALVHVLLALGQGPTAPVVTVLALIAIIGAGAVVVLTPGRRLSGRSTVATLLLVVAGVASIVPFLPAEGWPGYAAWPLGAGTFVAMAVTLRGRIAAGWLLLAAMAGLCLLWSSLGGAGIVAGLNLIDRQVGELLLSTLFAIGLARTARAHDELLVVRRQETLERDLTEAELVARQEAVRRVLADAGPILTRIAAGDTFDAAERGRIAAVEGRLRDEITLAPILSATLDHALEGARRRGLDVVVHTEPAVDGVPTPVRLRAAEWLATRLDGARGAEFVGRVVTRGQDVRVSATVDEHIEDRIISDTE
jgi:hypothetical protein